MFRVLQDARDRHAPGRLLLYWPNIVLCRRNDASPRAGSPPRENSRRTSNAPENVEDTPGRKQSAFRIQSKTLERYNHLGARLKTEAREIAASDTNRCGLTETHSATFTAVCAKLFLCPPDCVQILGDQLEPRGITRVTRKVALGQKLDRMLADNDDKGPLVTMTADAQRSEPTSVR